MYGTTHTLNPKPTPDSYHTGFPCSGAAEAPRHVGDLSSSLFGDTMIPNVE